MASKKSVAEWEEDFKKFDKNESGSLSIQELRDLMHANGSNVPDSQVADVFIECDSVAGDRKVTLEEFIGGMERLHSKIAAVKGLFEETDKDGSGYLTKEELRPLITNCYAKLTEDEIESIFTRADTSGEGKISLEEFLSTCT